MSHDRKKGPYRRKRIHRKNGKHQRPQIRRTHLPYKQQGSLELHKPVCRLQPLHQLTCGQLQGRTLQPAIQHEHILPDVGSEDPAGGKGKN